MNQGSKDDQMPWVIGHRGACGYAPENSRASINKAADLGVKCVEFDVKLTADRQPVLFHDTTLGRTSNGKGHVSQMNSPRFLRHPVTSIFAVVRTRLATAFH
ncbi:MAG: glycerophosphodiester phosphodiesterase, partial [Rhodospirillales bacterium]|nr:glycerophosphodiester phosphodiesterase [Rhodospirillales bacterium]